MNNRFCTACLPRLLLSLVFALGLGFLPLARADSTTNATAFTWQGRLTDGAGAANGRYDLRFVLCDAVLAGVPLGTNTILTASVSNGLFSVVLDFGADAFDGDPRWLELWVRTNGAAGFTRLSPRQALTPTPYALHARTSASVVGTIPDAQLPDSIPRLGTSNDFAGEVSAKAFIGNGGGLTNIPATAVRSSLSAINVRDYGAAGDGTTDDTAALQAAIDASAQVGASGDVFIPAGRYRLTSSLRIPPNDYNSQQAASAGPLRLVGSGSAASVLAFEVQDRAGIDFSSTGLNVHGFEIHRLGLEGPLATSWDSQNACVGVAGGAPANPAYSYQGTHFAMQSCAVIGWESGVALSNVWTATFDNCDFLNNRLHGLAFSCTHSVTVRNSHVSGQPYEGRLTGVGIGFFAPTQTNTWNFGDTAHLQNSRVDWCTNAIWNNELALSEIGGNHQYCGKFLVSRSGTRAVDGGVWRPYNVIINTMYCDCTIPWVTNGPACVELDSYNAERFTWIQSIGDVCSLNRALFTVFGTTNGGPQYLNYYPPTTIGGALPKRGLFNGTEEVTIHPLKSFQPTLNGPVTVTNANQYLPAVAILTGGQGSSRAPALAIGGDVAGNSMTANSDHVGAWHGYTYSNGNWTIPDLEVVAYRAAKGASYVGLGGTPGMLSTPGKGAQEIHFYTAPKPNKIPALAGGVNERGGTSFGPALDAAVTNGEVSARSGFVSYRTNAWPASALAANGFAFWNSNGLIYCSVNMRGSVTNKLVLP